jgi:toxin-antitoxin system PIN domain toxin
MILCFPDLNVWLALSDASHEHSGDAWRWMNSLGPDARLAFSRYTQIGLLRLLVSAPVMGGAVLTLRKAWDVYDRWLEDPRVEFYPEPRNAEDAFRRVTLPLNAQSASKAVGDCWLLAYATAIDATLVTFDRALLELSKSQGRSAIVPD